MKHIHLILLWAIVVGCSPKHSSQQPPVLTFTVATATEREVPNTIEFISETKPVRSYIIQPRVNGYLQSINFENGLPVRRGQLLFTIDPAPLQTAVAQAQASLSSARASLVEAQATYDRSVPLAKINAISQSQLDAATSALAAAKEQVESSKALLRSAQINIGYCTITAPESGIIAPSTANVGDYVGAGTAYQTLTTIAFDDSVSVNISLTTIEYFKVKNDTLPSYRGDSLLHNITLRLSDGSIYPYKGVYSYTNPLVDNQSGSIVFNVQFPNKEGRLKGGQFARVTANVGPSPRRVLIPSRAVNQVQGVYNTYIVSTVDTLEFRNITVGEVVGSEWVVLSGVKAGERVITDGMQKARSGMKIKY